jgi:hypothetical protein
MNGYIQFSLDGKKVGIKFAYPAMRMFFEAMQEKEQFYFVQGEVSSMTIEGLAKLIECGYKNNCLIKEFEPEITYEQFFNWVESAIDDPEKSEAISLIEKCYADSIYAKKIQEIAEEKKNLSGKMLTES